MADPLGSFTGLSSGMDWRGLVDQIVQLERRPAVKLQATIDANTKRKTALDEFQKTVQGFQSAAEWLRGDAGAASPFDSYSVATSGLDASGRTVLAATARAGASGGSYGIAVTSLASAQKWTGAVGRAPADTLDAFANSTLTLSKGGVAVTPAITVGTGWTLARLRDEIAKLNTGATPSGVQASVLAVSPTEQRLVLGATATGTANGFALDDGGSGLLAHLGLDADSRQNNPALVQAPVDAAFSIDGVAMTRATNTVADAIPGVTLTLSAKGNATVEVTRVASAASEGMKGLVETFNKMQAALTAARDPKSPLSNDPLLRTMRSELGRLVVTPAASGGTTGVSEDLASLASLGVSLQKDGTLTFDSARFATLTTERMGDVKAVLADRMAALAGFAEGIARPLTGAIDQREQNIDTMNGRYTSRIADIDARLEKRRAALLVQYSRFEGSLGRLKALGDQMGAQFAGLNRKSDS